MIQIYLSLTGFLALVVFAVLIYRQKRSQLLPLYLVLCAFLTLAIAADTYDFKAQRRDTIRQVECYAPDGGAALRINPDGSTDCFLLGDHNG